MSYNFYPYTGSDLVPVTPTGEPGYYPPGTVTTTSPGSAAAPTTPGSNSTLSSILQFLGTAATAYYAAKNKPKSAVATSQPSPYPSFFGFGSQSAPTTGYASQSQQPSLSMPLIIAGVAGVIVLLMLMRR